MANKQVRSREAKIERFNRLYKEKAVELVERYGLDAGTPAYDIWKYLKYDKGFYTVDIAVAFDVHENTASGWNTEFADSSRKMDPLS